MENLDSIIKTFFKKDSFDSEKLDILKQKIIDAVGYKNFKPYESIINLHLIKFKLHSVDKVKKNSPVKKNDNKNKRQLIQKNEANEEIEIFKNKYLNKRIDFIANSLNLKISYLINALKKENFDVTDQDYLSDHMLESIISFIQFREGVIKSIKVKEDLMNKSKSKKLNKKTKSVKESNSVYDKLKNNKQYIKLIYIRSK